MSTLVRKLATAALASWVCIAQAAVAAPQLHRPPRALREHRNWMAHAHPDFTSNVTMPKLLNEGGRVLTQARIVAVLWGKPDALAPTSSCDATTFKDCLDGYFQDFLSSPQFDWVTEYNTATEQISRAVYLGIYQITPANTASTVGESDIESEISSQIAAGNLPAPDAGAQTIYEIFFSLAVNPSDTNPESSNIACCDFCAYHSGYQSNTINDELIFGIFPSAVPGGYGGTCSGETYGPDCSGCGERDDWFQNLGGSISHEIFETITDPDVGIDSVGWYDEANQDAMGVHGEIADICAGFNDASLEGEITEETFRAPDGGSYTVQRLWSNVHNACLADPSGAFSILNPTQTMAVEAPRGSTTRISLPATGTQSGACPLPINYLMHYGAYPDAGLPDGVTSTLNPSSPETGENTVLTLTIGNSAPANFTFGISGENGVAQAQTVVKLTAAGPASDGGAPGAQTDGGSGGDTCAPPTASLSPATIDLSAGSSAQAVLTTSGNSGASYSTSSTVIAGLHVTPTSGTIGTPLTLTFTAASGAPSARASYSITINAAGSLATASSDLVLSGDDASLSAPATVEVKPGGSATFTLSSATVDGNPQSLSLSASGLPNGAAATFSPASITSGQSAQVTVSVVAAQPLGNSTFTLAAQGAYATVTTMTTLEVTNTPAGTGSSGCASPDIFPLALLGLLGLGKRRRKTAPA